MPELPEVETVRTGLQQTISGKRIAQVLVRKRQLRFPLPEDFEIRVAGKTITGIKRRAKYLLLELDSADVLLIHLGMSGRLLVTPKPPAAWNKHDHVVLFFADGSVMRFEDPRRFGCMDVFPGSIVNGHKLLKQLGPEPLAEEFSGDVLWQSLSRKKAPIKTTIMDQRVVVGVGNIYAAEALFSSAINPKRSAGSLSLKECRKLTAEIKHVLKAAIKSGGSTLRDYVRSSGDKGYFQHEFKAYGREGKPCFSCGNIIEKITQAGRSTFYCRICQR